MDSLYTDLTSPMSGEAKRIHETRAAITILCDGFTVFELAQSLAPELEKRGLKVVRQSDLLPALNMLSKINSMGYELGQAYQSIQNAFNNRY